VLTRLTRRDGRSLLRTRLGPHAIRTKLISYEWLYSFLDALLLVAAMSCAAVSSGSRSVPLPSLLPVPSFRLPRHASAQR